MKNPSTESPKPLNILSLGAGVQSTVLALMVEKGELPMVDAAIFADTGGEPEQVIRHLEWLESEVSYPVYKVMEKEGLTKALYQSAKDKTTRVSSAPFFTIDENGKKGIIRRTCTAEYKIKPVERKIRSLLGLKKGQKAGKEIRAIQWFGISLDEIQRLRTSKHKWLGYFYPLIEKKMTREDCLKWMEQRGYPEPPRSACTYCPYHSDSYWYNMKTEDPKSWTDAINMDRAIRDGIKGTTQQLFLHDSRTPLEDVTFKSETFMDQETYNFGNECEGMCGN